MPYFTPILTEKSNRSTLKIMVIYFEGADLTLKSSTAEEPSEQYHFNVRRIFLNEETHQLYGMVQELRHIIKCNHVSMADLYRMVAAVDLKMYRPKESIIQDSSFIVREYAINLASGKPTKDLDEYFRLIKEFPDFKHIIKFVNSTQDKKKWLQVRQDKGERVSSIDKQIGTEWFSTMENGINEILEWRYGRKGITTLDTTGMSSKDAAKEVRKITSI